MKRNVATTEYRDLQAVARRAMKAYENFDLDGNDSASLAEAHRLWNEAIDANDALVAASAKPSAKVNAQ